MEASMHGYELKQRLTLLTGHFRLISDGALYPAIARMERRGVLQRKLESGKAGAPRQMLSLTPAGESELQLRLGNPSDVEISDRNNFFTILAFLRYLSPPEQRAVLQRRLLFLEAGRGFFQKEGGQPVTIAMEHDPFRKGMLLIAKETRKVEMQWLRDEIDSFAL